MSIFVSSGSSSQPRLPARKQFNLFATVKIQRQQASFLQMETGGGGMRRGWGWGLGVGAMMEKEREKKADTTNLATAGLVS